MYENTSRSARARSSHSKRTRRFSGGRFLLRSAQLKYAGAGDQRNASQTSGNECNKLSELVGDSLSAKDFSLALSDRN